MAKINDHHVSHLLLQNDNNQMIKYLWDDQHLLLQNDNNQTIKYLWDDQHLLLQNDNNQTIKYLWDDKHLLRQERKKTGSDSLFGVNVFVA